MGRRIVWTVLGFAVVVAVAVAALWPVYVTPRRDEPAPADAILVLGGAHDGREQLALRLARAGYAPRVLVSDPYEGESGLINWFCNADHDFEVVCFDPAPRTTSGEARYLAEQARVHGWRRVIVVTFTPHITRSRYILGECWDGEALFVDPRPRLSVPRWAYDYLYQSIAFAKAVFQNC